MEIHVNGLRIDKLTVRMTPQQDSDLIDCVAEVTVPNSRNPDETITVKTCSTWAPIYLPDAPLEIFVWDLCMTALRHELSEFFSVDGALMKDPHPLRKEF